MPGGSEFKNIAVIGGGPAGASAALFLNRLGHHVTVYEREPTPKPIGAGIMLQPTGLKVLEQHGLRHQIESNGRRIEGVKAFTYDGKKVFDFRFDQTLPWFYGVGIHRGSLFSNLLNALEKAKIELKTDVEAADLLFDNASTVGFKDKRGKSYQNFDCIVVANGANNKLFNKLPIVKRSRFQSQGALWSPVKMPIDTYAGNIYHSYKGAQGVVGAMPIGYSDNEHQSAYMVNFFAAASTRFIREWSPEKFDSWKSELYKIAPNYEDLIDEVKSYEQIVAIPYRDVLLKKMHYGRVAFVGDAAHATGPHLTSGTNLALLDSWILAECIAENKDIIPALESYSKSRFAQVHYYHLISSLITPGFQSSYPMSWIRDLGLKSFVKIGFTRKMMMETTAGIKNSFFSNIDEKYYR